MWERVLEAEALALHRFLRRGGLPDVSELTVGSLDPLTEAASQLGVLLLPPGLGAAMRGYHIRRFARVAAGFAPWRCDAHAPREAVEPREQSVEDASAHADGRRLPWEWIGRSACAPVPAAQAVRFAYANSSVELAALLTARLGVLPADLPHGHQRQPRFALLLQHRPSWRVHAIDGPPEGARVATLVRRHLELAAAAASMHAPGGAPRDEL
jgi:hypothetical protein